MLGQEEEPPKTPPEEQGEAGERDLLLVGGGWTK